MLVAESNRALLATADGSGKPHSTYMNVLADSSMEEVVSITAPDTEKIKNLKASLRGKLDQVAQHQLALN